MGRWQKLMEAATVFRSVVLEHILAVDGLMKGPSTFERGQKIAREIGKLERAITDFDATYKSL